MHEKLKWLATSIQVILMAVVGLGCKPAVAAEQSAPVASAGVHTPKNTSKGMQGAPSVDLVVAAGAVGDDALAYGIYIFHLKCSGSCDLERITLNECSRTEAGTAAFIPRADLWSSSLNSMTIKKITGNQIELEVYQAFEHGFPATATFTFDSTANPFKVLTGFKTIGFLDLRSGAKTHADAQVDYVPLANDRLKTLDCPVSLRGLTHGP
jgi:hypothetical protein